MFVGVDIGSLVSKAVVIGPQGIAGNAIVAGRADLEQAALAAVDQALMLAGARAKDISFMVSTGYGRVSFKLANKEITELSCHGRGAHYLSPRIRTVIDIGGQDSKVLRIDECGNMVDFAMNDKCAAGTGRFLEVMAQALHVEIDDLGDFALRAENPLKISSTCTVFAETEVISFLASNQKKENIAAGIHAAVACRVGNMARSFGVQAEVAFVGGVAKNSGVRMALEQFLGVRFASLSFDPQLTGALGAALFAKDCYQEACEA